MPLTHSFILHHQSAVLKTLYLVSEFTIETLQHLSAVNGCSTPVLSYHQMFQFISAAIIRESSYPIQIARISTFGGHRNRTSGREGGSLCSVRVDGIIQFAMAFESSLIYFKYNGNYGDHATICVFLWM